MFHPQKGGIGKVTSTLMTYFRQNGHRVWVLAATDTGFADDGLVLIRSGNFRNTANNRQELAQTIADLRIDVIINQQGSGGSGSELAYRGVESGCKLISVIHTSLLEGIRSFEHTKRDRFAARGLEWSIPLLRRPSFKRIIVWMYKRKYRRHFVRLVEKSDKVLVVSDFIKRELAEYVDYPPSKVHTIPNPLAYTFREYRRTEKRNMVIWVGRADYSKRLDLFIEIWAKVSNDFANWRAVILGDGAELERARSQALLRGVSTVEFLGFRPARDYFEQASVLCFTSASEGFGLVLVEAMAAGCIPIAFDAFPAATDIIENGKTGFLIVPFDVDAYARTLRDLMLSEKMRATIGPMAQAKALRYGVDVIGRQWLDLLGSILARTEVPKATDQDFHK